MDNHKTSLQITKLFIGLEEIKNKIHGETLPLCAHLAPEETMELAQTLDLAASAIEQFQKQTRLQLSHEFERAEKEKAERRRLEICGTEEDAQRYRKLRPLFHKSIIMANGRRWWDCHLATTLEIETLDQVIDSMPGGQS